MAHSKSAKKRVLVAERNRERNQAVKSRVKTMLKKVLVAVETKEVEAANAALSVAYKELTFAANLAFLLDAVFFFITPLLTALSNSL